MGSSIKPRPSCEELLFIWNWRDYISPRMTKKKLSNHSFLHSFLIKKENGITLLRGKKYPQDTCEWLPKEGIELLASNVDLNSVIPIAPMRIEKLNLDAVYMGVVTKYIPYLCDEEKMYVTSSWERLKVKLENLPKKKNLTKMSLLKFPKQERSTSMLPRMLDTLLNCEERELSGSKPALDPEIGSFDSEIKVDMDVVIFTHVKCSRPWLGRVVSVSQKEKEFTIRWFLRKQKSRVFFAADKNGKPYTSRVSSDSVMLWNFSENRSDNSFEVSKECISKIMKVYEEHDSCYE